MKPGMFVGLNRSIMEMFIKPDTLDMMIGTEAAQWKGIEETVHDVITGSKIGRCLFRSGCRI